jgi:putative ABC transport system permease protein
MEKNMLELKNIKKDYTVGDNIVHALKGISISFRKNEFVSILGQSGCGKTTLLNLIGGLDQYTSGDMYINGKSTKDFNDHDWDSYRNHSIGFVFQNYNLIPHQTVLSNVELALTLSGVSKQERKDRAIAVLNRVGLGDQLDKKPNQMSGGQMQRVAIARALVNDPDIILADEPTGALDSETSVQIMNLLESISKEKLIIMVTHNNELAEKYSDRIIKLFDGEVIDDTNPYSGVDQEEKTEGMLKHAKKKFMSFWTALSLSLNNLLTKKGRTILTAFAGSIGIIGIALILSVSNGVNSYIKGVENNTMSSYPLKIDATTMDTSSLMSALTAVNKIEKNRDPSKIYSSDIMIEMMESVTEGFTTNNLPKFMEYIEDPANGFYDYVIDIKYQYQADLNTYSIHENDGKVVYKKNLGSPKELLESIGYGGVASAFPSVVGQPWTELLGDAGYIQEQYDLVYGKYPTSSDEVILIVDKNNQITDYILYTLGIRDTIELKQYLEAAKISMETGVPNTYKISPTSYTFDQICNYKFKVLLDSDYYKMQNDKIVRKNDFELNYLLSESLELKVVGIVTPTDESLGGMTIGSIGYLPELMPSLIERVNNSDVVLAQLNNPTIDMFTGLVFKAEEYTMADIEKIKEQIVAMNPAYAEMMNMMTDEQLLAMANSTLQQSSSSYAGNLKKLGYVDFKNPHGILIYPKDFDAKDVLTNKISEYNNKQDKADRITYTDTVALLMSSVTTIVNAISYVLIAFVAISLVVSSIMIGIITYISVLERTKEIGILRAIGASKKDISQVFNAETFIIGLCAGIFGIGITLCFNAIINTILYKLTNIASLKAALPPIGGILLIAISIGLTLIAGIIPSRVAAKKDPVIALRSE